MRTLYESILKSNSASAGSLLDDKLKEHSRSNTKGIFFAGVTYDFFVKWLDENKFSSLCNYALRQTRESRSKYDFDRFLKIKLSDGNLVFRFLKDRGSVRFTPFLTDSDGYSYWSFREDISNSIDDFCQPMSVPLNKQLLWFYRYFKSKSDEIKRCRVSK